MADITTGGTDKVDLTTKQVQTEDVTTSENIGVNLNVLNTGQNVTTQATVVTTVTERISTTQKQTTQQTTTTQSTRVNTSLKPTKKPTTLKVQVVVSAKSEPPYKILTVEPESSTAKAGITPDGAKKGMIIGVSVGVILGIILIAAIILLVFFLKRRKNKNLEKDMVQVENPRYQPATDRTRGQFRFFGDKGANNNTDGDIEVLATRSSSRKKRKAPPPPNPFGDEEFTGDRRASQDPDLSPPPVELSTFAHLSGTDKEEKSPEEKPLLKKNGKANQDSNVAESDENSDLDDKDTSKLVLDEESEVKMPKTPDDYDKSKNPFAES